MSNAFVIIKMCYVHNQWYDISRATLYFLLNSFFSPSFVEDRISDKVARAYYSIIL